MGNTILGKRSRNFYKGFNERQLIYIKQKFQIMSKKGNLDRNAFKKQYQLNDFVTKKFYQFVDFDQNNQIDEYQFICAVHTFCNMTVSELAQKFFCMCTSNNEGLNQKELKNVTQVCLKYNYYLQDKRIDDKQIVKKNRSKFKKYDFDKSGLISKDEFIKLYSKDEDYKKWLYNMGFITKNQLDFNDQVYDLVDSDIQSQIQRHITPTDPNVDKIKRGIEHRLKEDEFQVVEVGGDESLPPGQAEDAPKTKDQQTKKPWQQTIIKQRYENNKKAMQKQNLNSPSQTLSLKHVFGYRSYDCRNNIKFDSKGNVIYHQGSLGIVMNSRRQQFFMNQHKDDITCLDVNGQTVVTGELGSAPQVIIWKSKANGSLKSELTITEKLKQSVGNVTFSNSLEYLAVNCNDSNHQLVIYRIADLSSKTKKERIQAKVEAYGALSKNAIFDLKFTSDQKIVVAASLKQILFVRFQNSTLNGTRGQFGNFSNSCALCLLPLKTKYKKEYKNWMVSGMTNGSVYFWEQGKCVKAVVGHSGSVSALATSRNNEIDFLVSGDKTGKILVWNQNFQIAHRCSVSKSQTFSNMIVSISVLNLNEKEKQILVGTKASTVYRGRLAKDLILKQDNAIINGHCEGNIWALAVDQSKNTKVFYTGGEDQRLIKWSYGSNPQENKLLMELKCKAKIRSLSHNSQLKMIAVGFMNGVIQIMKQDLQSTNIKFDLIKNPDKQVLSLVKFSEKGDFLLSCYRLDKEYQLKIFTFNSKQLNKQKKIKSNSKIVSVDFQQNCKYVRFNTEDYNFKVFDISDSEPFQIKGSKEYNMNIPKVQWQSHTTILSPQTRGFKTEGVEQSDVVCCERSRNQRNVMVVGDKYSKIKLFNFPCVNYPIFNKYEGHSNAVTGIQFNGSDSHLISIGGEQKSIIVWQYDPDQINNKKFFQQNQNSLNKEKGQLDFERAKGQQCRATDHYRGQIKEPSDFKQKYNAKRDNKLPRENLVIEHVFGIRNQYLKDQVRNMCKFSKNFDQILFPTACLGVKMHIKTKKQQYFLNHKEDIVSFAVDRSRNLMATGQMAQKNTKDPRKKIVSICVWDTESQKLLKKLDGFHTIAVVLLEFSPSGKYLFSVGNDSKNSYVVYDWKAGAILYSGPVSGGKVNGVCWKNQTEFMTCGNDHVKFWENGKGKQGKFQHGAFESLFSCAYYEKDNIFLTGSGNGNVHSWSGNKTLSINKAHSAGKVQTIVVKGQKIFTGGDDGVVKMWRKGKNHQLQQLRQLFAPKDMARFKEIKGIQQEEFGVLSLDIGDNMDTLIVTKGASVIYFRSQGQKNAQIIHQGHYKGELWGLTTHSDNRYIATGGDDKSVRLWDMSKKEQVRRIYFQSKVRALDWQSSSPQNIVVADYKAKLYIIDKQVTSVQDQYMGKPFHINKNNKIQPWVQQIKFSPSTNNICYGTHGQSRTLEVVPVKGKKFDKQGATSFKGGSSAVNHIDWSRDQKYLAVNTQACEYYFFTSQGKDVSASSLRNQAWSSWSRKYGFQSQGIFQDADHSNINTICRDSTSSVVAVGYDDQTIRLFKYPCYIPHQVFKTYYGHSSHVTRIKFTDSRMVSIGGLDRTIIVWSVQGRQRQVSSQEQEDDGLQDVDEDIDLPMKLFRKKPKQEKHEDFQLVQNQGDQFMAIKPWVGAIKQPTYKYPKPNPQQPDIKLDLQYVFGYRSKDCRQNLFYEDNCTIIYHAAAVLVYHDIEKNTQEIFSQHNDDILSIDYEPNSRTVMTGEIGPKPLVCLYKSAKFHSSFKAPVTKGVISVSISPNAKYGLCVGIDQNHQIAVLDLQKNKVLHKVNGGRKVITKIKWKDDKQFVTIGINCYEEWRFQYNKISKNKVPFTKANYVSLDISKSQNLILAGGSNGSLYDYSSSKTPKAMILKNLCKIQKTKNEDEQQKERQVGVIQCIRITPNFVACGTKNGVLVFLSKRDLSTINTVDLNVEIKSIDAYQRSENLCIRSIDFIGSKILIGTFGSQIYEAELDKANNIVKKSLRNIMKCHYTPNNSWTNEVWGLSVPESGGDYSFSCSDDSTIRVWSLSQRKLVYCHNVNENKNKVEFKNSDYPDSIKLRSVQVSPNNQFVAVGSKDGTVRIFSFDPDEKGSMLEQVLKFKHAKQWISDIKFGYKTLIVGSHDNGIYVYNFDRANETTQEEREAQQEGLEVKMKYKPLKKHSSYITHVDVSRDSCFLQSTCGAYQLLFWDINTGKQITAGGTMLKNQIWKTWTCNLGWPVQGIYPKNEDGTYINAVHRSNSTIKGNTEYKDRQDYFILAAGNDSGKVCIYNYPSVIKNSKFVEGKGHSSHVTNVRWTKDDQRIVSVGGEDQCVMIWKVGTKKGKK